MDIPYTRDRTHFHGQLLGWGVIFFVEGLVIAVLILIFAPSLWLKLLLATAWIALLVWFVRYFLMAPARTQHFLNDTTLELRYGPAQVDIPRSRILRAEAAGTPSGPAFVNRPVDEESTSLLRVTFSRHGQILLHLDPPLDLPRKKGVFSAEHVLFNADDPDAVLDALARDTTPDTVEAEPVKQPLHESIAAPLGSPDHRDIAIEALELTRSFGDRTAVDNLTMRVHAGEIYGFIGPNGAGKTTTISMLVGLLAPTRGIIRIAGHDLALNPIAAKQALGYVPDRPVLYDSLTGRENLEFIAQMRGFSQRTAGERLDELLTTLQVRDRADELVRTWSFGMRNKLALAMALFHQPSVLILDEPFNGLDPKTSHSLRTLIIEQARRGTCVLLSTHDLALVERMCHSIGVIERGRLIAQGDPVTIRRQADNLEDVFLALTDDGVNQ